MRALITLYLTIGIVLLLLGLFATGDCPDKNTDVVSDVVFVSTTNLGRFNRVLSQILPAVQTVWQTWDIVRHP